MDCNRPNIGELENPELLIEEYKAYKQSEILPLYAAVGWTNYTNKSEMLKASFLHSLKTLVAIDHGRIVGLIRAVGDGYSIVYIQDIIVHPDYQRRGIGTRLVKEMLKEYSDVYQIVLSTDNQEKTMAFYESVGFTAHSKLGCAAFFRIKAD